MILPADTPRAASPGVEAIPLGGLGEFGLNTMLVVWGDTGILIDAGGMFPGPELPGVDLIVPDYRYIEERVGTLTAIVLTHGHEDHIGALPYVWPLLNGPVYGTRLTLALLAPKLNEHGLEGVERCLPVEAGDTVEIGELQVEFIRVTHSMPDCVAIAVHTPVGTLVHTGDFKFDQTPLDDKPCDIPRLAELGRAGVLAMFGDSTNIERPGFTGSEREVVTGLEEVFASARGLVVVTTFASSLHRIQVVVDLAAKFGRKLAFIGRGMLQNTEIASELGYLRIPAGLQIRDTEVNDHDRRRVVCLATGSQGEHLAALSRIAANEHRHIALEPEDVVVFSARAIPGNRRAIGRVMDQVARRGAEIVHEEKKLVHVSGHGSAEELKLMLSLLRPRYFVPIHGEYRYLAEHAHAAARVTKNTTTVLLAEDGDVIQFSQEDGRIIDHVEAGRILMDSTRSGEVVDRVLKDRRRLAMDGVIVPVITVNRESGNVGAVSEVTTRGMAVDSRTESLLKTLPDRLPGILDSIEPAERSDQNLLTERVRIEVQRLFRKHTGHRPLVLPIIREI